MRSTRTRTWVVATAAALVLAVQAQAAPSAAAEEQYRLANHYRGHTGARFDPAQALVHLRQAAELGHGAAQTELAFMYYNGNDKVPKDLGAAFQWFGTAAASGSVVAKCMLGDFHRDGLGGAKQSNADAFKWYHQAAQENDRCAPKAQYELYVSYDSGRGVGKDAKTAIAWLRKAADGNDPQAQRTLARLYDRGHGVARDPELARRWLLKSREGVSAHDDHDHDKAGPGHAHEARTSAANSAARRASSGSSP